MKTLRSVFYSESLFLTFKEWLLLPFKNIKHNQYIVGMWKMPDNGCSCSNCRRKVNKTHRQLKKI